MPRPVPAPLTFAGFAALVSLVLSLLSPSPAVAAEAPWRLHEAVGAPKALKLSGSVRARYEVIDGQARAGLPSSEDLVNFRSTLLAEYTSGAFRFGTELWDSRVYGGKRGGAVSTGEVNALEFVQAYAAADFRAGAGAHGTLQAGRFVMNLGSRRFVAADDYRNTTNGYTGVKLDLTGKGGAAATLFYTLPQVRLPDGQPALLDNRVRFDRESGDLKLWGAIAAAPVAGLGLGEAGFIGLQERDAPGRPTRDRNLRTVTARLIRNPAPHRFDYETEAAYQFGEVSAGTAASAPALDVSAYFVHLDAGYQFAGRWKPHLSVEYDRVSGDHGAGRYNRFDTLYGMRRGDFAPAGLYNAIARANLSTPGLRLEATPSARLDGFVTVRAMWLASETDAFSATAVRDASGRSGRHAGEQLEGRVRYWLVPDSLRLEADAAWLHKGRFLEAAPNRPAPGDTAYLSLNLTASF
jgi:hypothetical protein